MENKDFRKQINKAKHKSQLKTVGIVLLVLIVFTGVFSVFNINSCILDNLNDESNSYDTFNIISAPNKFIGEQTRNRRFLAEKNTMTLYKYIEGIPVYSGEKEFYKGINFDDYSNIGTFSPCFLGKSWNESDTKNTNYNIYGQREMVFYYPYVKYNFYKNDLKVLDEINNDKYMEMALSFDDFYTIKEVKKMIPENITIAWYWVDTDSKEDKDIFDNERKMYDIVDGEEVVSKYYDPRVCSEYHAYGIKAYQKDGSSYEGIQPVEFFMIILEKYHNDKSIFDKYRNEMDRIYNNLLGEDDQLTLEDIKIQGVVVTGDKEELENLKNLDFIKASSLGVVVDKY